jgi:hypothetical protein
MEVVNPRENSDFEKIKSEVFNKMKDIGISKKTLHTFLQIIIETVEQKQVKGDTKKELAILIMTDLVETIPQGGEKEFILELLHNGTISNMIDLVVLASRGEVNINKVIAVSSNCCYGFFSRRR